MQFLLFDVGVTLVFLGGYLTVVRLQRRRALALPRAASGTPRREPRPAPGSESPAVRPARREWPRLSYPR